jgi:serine/threonine-protein kinase
MGEVRAKQLRLKEADEVLKKAIERLTELARRHPKNGEFLFERAQTELWIGNQHRRRGEFTKVGEWLTRHCDSGAALAALDPKNLKRQQEAVSGMSNLAALEFDRGDLVAAEVGFTRSLAARRPLAEARPDERLIEFGISNNVSFLGTVAERGGDLATATARYAEQVRLLEALVATEPMNPRWQERLANALALESGMDHIGGRSAEALKKLARARAMLDPLVEQDPTNGVWVLTLLRIEQRIVPALRSTGDIAATRRLLTEGMARLGRLGKEAFAEIGAAKVQVGFWRAEAEHRAAVREPGAAEAAQKAVASGEEHLAKETGNVETLADHLRGCVSAAQIAGAHGDATGARRHAERVIALAGGLAQTSRNWAVLAPVARA